MTITVLAVVLGIGVGIIGFAFGYLACPTLTAGSVLLQQIGLPGKYGVIKMPTARKSICVPVTIFTVLGAVIGAGAGVIIGVALKLAWW